MPFLSPETAIADALVRCEMEELPDCEAMHSFYLTWIISLSPRLVSRMVHGVPHIGNVTW